jgi:hypothetical protein
MTAAAGVWQCPPNPAPAIRSFSGVLFPLLTPPLSLSRRLSYQYYSPSQFDVLVSFNRKVEEPEGRQRQTTSGIETSEEEENEFREGEG